MLTKYSKKNCTLYKKTQFSVKYFCNKFEQISGKLRI